MGQCQKQNNTQAPLLEDDSCLQHTMNTTIESNLQVELTLVYLAITHFQLYDDQMHNIRNSTIQHTLLHKLNKLAFHT